MPLESSKQGKVQALRLAYLGWIVATGVISILKVLGYSDIRSRQILIFFGAATAAHMTGWLMIRLGWDRRLSWDPHFVVFPNWFLFAPVAAYGFYAVGTARDLMLVGWLMGLFFLAGHVRFRGVLLTACWYMALYCVVLAVGSRLEHRTVDVVHEIFRILTFLAVCVFFGLLLDRFATQKTHLKTSLAQLREKDREITRLNQRLSLFVSDPLVEHLAASDETDIFLHQRRKVTIFFSDICRFSTITDAMEPEELAQQLNEYFDEMIHIVFHHGGTVDKLMGDGLMVLFGAPGAMEPAEGAYRCACMALDMQGHLRDLNVRWERSGYPHSLEVRMGMHTGVCIVGSFGCDRWLNYTAIGSQVNIAARLQDNAAPGEILLSHASYALIADKVEANEVGELQLKGLHYPVKAYRLERLRKKRVEPRIVHQGPGYRIELEPEKMDPQAKEKFVRLVEEISGRKEKNDRS